MSNSQVQFFLSNMNIFGNKEAFIKELKFCLIIISFHFFSKLNLHNGKCILNTKKNTSIIINRTKKILLDILTFGHIFKCVVYLYEVLKFLSLTRFSPVSSSVQNGAESETAPNIHIERASNQRIK